MITKYSFDCSICGKHFEVNGYWYNQCIIHHYLNSKFLIHCILKKEYKNKSKILDKFLKMILIWLILLPIQFIEILLEPFRRIYG